MQGSLNAFSIRNIHDQTVYCHPKIVFCFSPSGNRYLIASGNKFFNKLNTHKACPTYHQNPPTTDRSMGRTCQNDIFRTTTFVYI